MSWIIFLAVLLIVLGALYVARTVGLPWDDEPRDPPPELRYVDRPVTVEEAERAEAPLLILAAVVVATLLAILIGVRLWSSPSHPATESAPSRPSTTLPTEAARVPARSSPNPATGSPGFGSPSFGEPVQFQTAGRDVHLRAAATTDSAVVGMIVPFGSTVTLSCYRQGQPVYRDTDWFLANYQGTTGYISGLWLNAAPVVATLTRCS